VCTQRRQTGREGVSLHSVPTLELDGSKWSASNHGCVIPWEELWHPLNRMLSGLAPDTVWTFWNLLFLPGTEPWMIKTIATSLDQYCPTGITQNTFRVYTVTRGISTYEFSNTANNSKYPSKYGRNWCPLITNTGIISLHYKLPLWFLTSTRFHRQIDILLQVSHVSCKAYLTISIINRTTKFANKVLSCACNSHA